MKVMRQLALLLAISVCISAQARAETKTFTKQHSYQATEADSKQSAQWTTLEQTERALLEELCAYLQRMSEVRNLNLGMDELLSLTAGITNAEVVDEEWDGENYRVQSKIAVDLESLIQSIDKLKHNDRLRRELTRRKQAIDQALDAKDKQNKQIETAYYDMNTKYETYEAMVKRITDRQKKGASFLAMAKEAATKPGFERQAREYRQKAIELLGNAVVQTELPEFKIYIPGKKYTFSLKAGEQTDHWLTFPDRETKFKLFQEKGSKFMRVYDDDSTTNDKENIFGKSAFKLRAIKNSYIVLEVMND